MGLKHQYLPISRLGITQHFSTCFCDKATTEATEK